MIYKDTGEGINKFTEELATYHIQSGEAVYNNHLQIAGHVPIICLEPVDFGDVLVPAPLRLQQALILGLPRSYGFVCSKKILSQGPVAGLYAGDPNWNGSLDDLDYKVGISLSSNKNQITLNGFSNSTLAGLTHVDIINNIINKAKPSVTVQENQLQEMVSAIILLIFHYNT